MLPVFRLSCAACALVLLAAVSHAQTATPAVSTVAAFYPSSPAGNLAAGPDGVVYGAAAYASSVSGGLIYRAKVDGSEIRTLYQIPPGEAVDLAAGPLLASDGRLYGTTKFGRSGEANGAGTIYRVSTTGTEFTVIHRFAPVTRDTETSRAFNAEGAYPEAELYEGSDTWLYGVARFGGPGGTGTVFKVTREGTGFEVLHAFDANTSTQALVTVNADGAYPVTQLVQGADGYLYGVTPAGGEHGNGTVYRLRTDGTGFQVLHAFSATTTNTTTNQAENEDGASPGAGLIDGGDGFFYGTTTLGGLGRGVVYAISPDGSTFEVLYKFNGDTGSVPLAELTLGSDGRLYGTTSGGGVTSGGASSTLGTIFVIDRAGTNFTRLHSFDGTVGFGPASKLVEVAPGELVGTAATGGRCGSGGIYRWSAAGNRVTGSTDCGVPRNDGGGAAGPALLLLLLGGWAWMRRRSAV
jgi:uncharacterized repeat protein (TIGR03803 family)